MGMLAELKYLIKYLKYIQITSDYYLIIKEAFLIQIEYLWMCVLSHFEYRFEFIKLRFIEVLLP